MKSLIATLALASSTLAWAAESPDYFPLQVGNQWVLQTAASEPELLTVEVHRSRTVNEHEYYLVSGYAPEDRWIRKTAEGTIYALDEKTGQEEKLADLLFGAQSYATALSGCAQTARAAAEAIAYKGPHFSYDNTLSLQYAPESCRDVGITAETYAPGVGLVQRAITTIRGELRFDLVYARINGSPLVGKSGEIVLVYGMSHGSKGWLPGFSDYSLQTGDLRMLAETRALPEELGRDRSGYYIQSMNRSDDMFMFLKRQVSSEDGLQPNKDYRVFFDIRLASDAPSGCIGVGGAPGESVYLKAGASANEPVPSVDENGDIRLKVVDKGEQATGGRDAGIAGTIDNGTPCEGSRHEYVRFRRTYAHPEPVRTDDRGWLWLLTGTDSGYEGLTGLYIESITARINAAAELPAQ